MKVKAIIKTAGNFFPYFALLTLSCILINNAFYGFEWTDEPYYIQSAHMLLFAGLKPYLDYFPLSFWQYLLFPFYFFYLKITGSSEGIILATRIAYIVFLLFIAIFTYTILKKKSDVFVAFFSAIFYLLYSKYNVYGFSYNSFSLGFFLIGILLLYDIYFSKTKNIVRAIFAGISFAFVIVSNPYFLFVHILASIAFLFWKKRNEYLSIAYSLWLATIAIGIVFAFFLFANGKSISETISHIINTFHQNQLRDPSHFSISPSHKFFLFLKNILLPYAKSKIIILIVGFIFISLFSFTFAKKNKKEKLETIFFILTFVFDFIFLLYSFYFVAHLDIAKHILVAQHYATLFWFSLPLLLLAILKNNLKIIHQFFGNGEFFFIIAGISFSLINQFSSDNTVSQLFLIGFPIIVIAPLFFLQKINFVFEKKKAIYFSLLISVILVFLFSFDIRINSAYREKTLPFHIFFEPKKYNELSQIQNGPAKGLWTQTPFVEKYKNYFKIISSLSFENHETLFVSVCMPHLYFTNINCVPYNLIMENDIFTLDKYKVPNYIFVIEDAEIPNNAHSTFAKDFVKTDLSSLYENKKFNNANLFIKKR